MSIAESVRHTEIMAALARIEALLQPRISGRSAALAKEFDPPLKIDELPKPPVNPNPQTRGGGGSEFLG